MPFLPLLFQAINEALAAQTSVPANQGIDTAYVILGGGLLTLFGTLGAAIYPKPICKFCAKIGEPPNTNRLCRCRL